MSDTLLECEVDGCDYLVDAKGLCAAHYRRQRLGKDLLAPMKRRRPPAPGSCSVEGCELPRDSKGMCQMHYTRMRRHGETGRGHVRRACAAQGCDSPAIGRGLCASCYQRELYRGSFDKPLCAVEGCGVPRRTKGLCGRHYARTRNGIPIEAPAPRKRGSGTKRNGYIQVKQPDGSLAMAHRLVMQEVLGRPLRPYENVHHINGIRDDNRPENLELWAKPQPNGQRVLDLVEWVVGEYRDEVLRLIAEGVV